MTVYDTSLNPYFCHICKKTHNAHDNIPHTSFLKQHWSYNAKPLTSRPMEFQLMSWQTQKIAA